MGSAFPPDMKRGQQGQCFRNAWQLSLSHGLPYCEGYGWDVELGALPFPHAWNRCRSSGRVIDTTWAIGRGAVYLGIELSPKQLMNIINLTECFGVLQDGRREALEIVEHTFGPKSIAVDADDHSPKRERHADPAALMLAVRALLSRKDRSCRGSLTGRLACQASLCRARPSQMRRSV